MSKTLWEKHENLMKHDPEEATIRIMHTVDAAMKKPDSVQSLGSFAKFANDEPDKPAPNDGPQNKGGFKP